MFRQCFKDLVNPLAFLKVGTLPYPTWFKRSREWGEERGEVATPSENEFKNYSLPSAYSAKGSWKNETVVHLGKLSCLTTPVHGRHFFLHPGPSSLRPTEEIKKTKTKNPNPNIVTAALLAIPWQQYLGRKIGRSPRLAVRPTPHTTLPSRPGGSAAIRPRRGPPPPAPTLPPPAQTPRILTRRPRFLLLSASPFLGAAASGAERGRAAGRPWL